MGSESEPSSKHAGLSEEEGTENKDPNVSKLRGPKTEEPARVPQKPVENVHQGSLTGEKASTTSETPALERHTDATANPKTSEIQLQSVRPPALSPNVATKPEIQMSEIDSNGLNQIGLLDATIDADEVAASKGKSELDLLPCNGKKIQHQAHLVNRRKPKRLTFQVDRISLDDPMYQHGRNWHDVILPRLHSFATAIYTIRQDDCKRYRLLQSCSDPLGQLEPDAWELLFEECKWLKDCDTAFRRERRS
jgi:hypothetical protein